MFELKKFNISQIENEQQRWLKFFKEGELLNDTALPEWMHTKEMTQAMNTVSLFSEKEREYFIYQARQEFLREQKSLHQDRERSLALLQEAQKREAEAQKDKAEAQKREAEAQKAKVEAQKREAEAQKREAEAQKREAEAQQQKKEAQQREIEALMREQAQLAEIEQLKSLLNQK